MSSIVYVLGLGHSGSTVFGMMMASSGVGIALGEVRTVMRMPVSDAREKKCTCGTSASACPFWGPTLARLGELSSSATLNQRYEIAFEMFDQTFGPEKVAIDMSKNKQGLAAAIGASGNRSVEPILIAKDVRSYTISALENVRRKSRGGSLVRIFPEIVFQDWYRRNRDREAAVTHLLNRAPLVVTYELLCLNTLEAADRLSDHLGKPFIERNATPGSGVTHIISGNRMSHDRNKTTQLSYDYRWFFRDEWVRPYNLMPWVRSYNRYLHSGEAGLFDNEHSV